MSGAGLGIRCGSYGSLEKQLLLQQQPQQPQNGSGVGGGGGSPLLPVQTAARNKPGKTSKDRDRVFHWICKFAGRKKVGMLFLCLVSAVVFLWVLYVEKGLPLYLVVGF